MNTNRLLRVLPELGILVTVIETGSFSAAARRIGLPPSSISRSMSKLEEELGAKLLERTTRTLALTSAGRVVHEQAVSMMDAAKAAVSSTQSEQDELKGVLRVAAPKAFCKHIMTPLVFRFMALHPKLRIQLTASDNLIDPTSGDVDIVFHVTDSPIENLVAHKVGHVNQVVCTTPAYLADRIQPCHPQDLLDHPCIALGERNDDHCWYFAKEGELEQVRTQGFFASNHSEIRLAAVTEGLGISVFPEFVVAEAIAAGQLVPMLTDWVYQGSYHGDVYAQHSQSRFVPATIRRFIKFVQAELSTQPAQAG